MPLIRSASLNLFIEIVIRIILVSIFCYMETMQPFIRVIHASELESDCKYPRRESYVPGGALWAVVLSVPCVLSLLAWGVYNDCNDALEPFIRVIHASELESDCKYPRRESYVPGGALWAVVLSAPCVLSLLAWGVYNDRNDALEILLTWSLTLGINGVITDTMKLIVGRPRPDFFYRCFPDGMETPDLQCTGDPSDIMEGRKSFPSGHSSLSFSSLGLASLWVCGRLGVLSSRRGSGPRVVACLGPLLLALCIALSRTCDYHHHWQDILVGSTLGFSVALFCYRQYFNPLTSDLSGVPYVVSNTNSKFNGKPDVSPVRDTKEMESTPLLNGVKKEDKWI